MNFLSAGNDLFTFSMGRLPRLEDLRTQWLALERRADGSFFTSWTWIGAWLSTLPPSAELDKMRLLTVRAGELIVGLAVVGERRIRIWDRRPILALHQSGHPTDDAVYIEYNDFMLDRRYAEPARAAVLRFLAQESAWQEVRLSGVTAAVHRSVQRAQLPHRVLADRICPWIDLLKVPPGLSGYLAILSKNTRQQIQRSLRLYEREGPVTLHLAQTSEEAQVLLYELRDFHQKGWQERKGHSGAFSVRFSKFAEALTHGAPGSVQLSRASAGETPFGYLLNFVHNGHVYAYQSGFAYRADNRFRPGLLTHALAVTRARSQGLRGYHFMAGENRYKSSLSNSDEHLLWATVRRPGLISRAGGRLRSLWVGSRLQDERTS